MLVQLKFAAIDDFIACCILFDLQQFKNKNKSTTSAQLWPKIYNYIIGLQVLSLNTQISVCTKLYYQQPMKRHVCNSIDITLSPRHVFLRYNITEYIY